jgi:hypothetical protein
MTAGQQAVRGIPKVSRHGQPWSCNQGTMRKPANASILCGAPPVMAPPVLEARPEGIVVRGPRELRVALGLFIRPAV